MSRSPGATSFTTRPPMRSVPALISSSPATMRNSVVLPQPDGPTSTSSSPSATSKLAPATATWPFGYCLRSLSSCTCATRSSGLMSIVDASRRYARWPAPCHPSHRACAIAIFSQCKRFHAAQATTAGRHTPMSSAPAKDFRFPPGFLWGAATAAHQIEGSPLADGAGPSIWTRFAHTPGMTLNGDTGDVACDHYHRWKDDVRLMRELGLQAYRFSVSWSRILPEGTGRVNQAGLDFYSRLVDELLENGIEPLLTLFHWDLPAALDDKGGWLNRDSADWFAEYGSTLYRALDGRVRKWATINEPWLVTDGGYLHGALAPGHRSRFEAPIAAHSLMRAHGAAVQAYRAEGAHEIGLVVNIEPKYPASDSAADIAATRRA